MKAKGFTLIELVTVVVILGIVAVVAAPKFLDAQDDARNAVLASMAGTIKSTAETTYGKMAIEGLENHPYVTTHDNAGHENALVTDLPFSLCKMTSNTYCVFRFGYPDSDPVTLSNLVKGIRDYRSDDYDFVAIYGDSQDIESAYITFRHNVETDSSNQEVLKEKRCYIKYTRAMKVGDRPTTEVIPCV
ncbi:MULTISPECIES: type II secretion system protein [Photobacterium]|uniref:type II secretion system protein n=1 Tax=Photobacterium TaxID=657 RepID=UPI001C2DEFAA|nr:MULTISPECIES: type II secretion system protein [Photobacterium]MBV1839819.1 type II secretion system GspH family protein [Photobacterium ganghwense]